MVEELEKALINDFKRIRKKHKLTQQQMSEQGGLIREQIAKIECHMVHPQINTLIKVLSPLGYTLKISKIKNNDNKM